MNLGPTTIHALNLASGGVWRIYLGAQQIWPGAALTFVFISQPIIVPFGTFQFDSQPTINEYPT